VFLSTILKF